MKLNKDVIYRNIAGEQVLIPVGQMAIERNGMFVLSELGGVIWNMLEQGMEKEAIFEELLKEYDVEKEVLRKDMEEFLEKLVEGKLIEL